MTQRLYQTAKSSRRYRLWLMAGLLTASYALANIGFAWADAPTALPAGSIIINEVKSGGPEVTAPVYVPKQYVTLYNNSDSDITVDGWKLEFAKQPASCPAAVWKTAGAASTYAVELAGKLLAHTVSTAVENLTITDNTAGAVHIVDANGTIQDTVSWGWTDTAAPCPETTAAPKLTTGSSLQRFTGCVSHLPIDTDNNADDFWLNDSPVPGTIGGLTAPQCAAAPEPVPTPDPTPSPSPTQAPPPSPAPTPVPTPQPNCQGVVISELMPNPAGTDTSHEFIELHNPTDEVINLQACSLETSASTTKNFVFGDIEMQPDSFQAFYDSTTGLTLPNASGGSVWLFSGSDELQAVSYPADPEDDTVWAFVDGAWATSYTATPGGYNTLVAVEPCPDGQVRNIETNRCAAAIADTAGDSGLTPCDAGQERNPETNRCRNIVTTAATASAACPAGQVRNPETNRCRSATTAAASSLTACKEGQERNPETNRCRNITTATADKACPAGQERNPDTNRCRKTTAAGSSNGKKLDGVQDVSSSPAAKNKPYLVIAGVLLAVVIGYAVYEWRQEIRLFFSHKFTKPKPVLES